jgi:hypothetical protein
MRVTGPRSTVGGPASGVEGPDVRVRGSVQGKAQGAPN